MADLQNLKAKAVTGSIWAIVEKFSLQIVSFVVSVILARLLGPKDYGLVAMTAIFTTLSMALLDGGFEKTLIRTADLRPIQVNSVFYVNLALGLLLTGILIFAARPIALYFNEPQLRPVLQILSLGLPLNALTQVQRVLLIKELKFKKISTTQIASSLTGAITGIVMAYAGMGVWALVATNLVTQVVILIMFWIRSDWYPKLQFSFSSIREMLPYGSRILVMSLLFFFMQQFNSFIVGKKYHDTELGYYNRGGRFPDLLFGVIQSIVLKMAFPLFAKVQDDRDQLETVLRKVTQLVGFIFFPLLALMMVNASDLTIVVCTAKWQPSVIFMQLICLITLFEPFVTIYRELILAKGHARLGVRIFVVSSFLEVGLVIGLADKGIQYIIWASIIGKTVQYIAYAMTAAAVTKVSWKRQLAWIGPYLLISAIMGLAVKGLGYLLAMTPLSMIARLALNMTAGGVLYLLLSLLFRLNELSLIKTFFRRIAQMAPVINLTRLYKKA